MLVIILTDLTLQNCEQLELFLLDHIYQIPNRARSLKKKNNNNIKILTIMIQALPDIVHQNSIPCKAIGPVFDFIAFKVIYFQNVDHKNRIQNQQYIICDRTSVMESMKLSK